MRMGPKLEDSCPNIKKNCRLRRTKDLDGGTCGAANISQMPQMRLRLALQYFCLLELTKKIRSMPEISKLLNFYLEILAFSIFNLDGISYMMV